MVEFLVKNGEMRFLAENGEKNGENKISLQKPAGRPAAGRPVPDPAAKMVGRAGSARPAGSRPGRPAGRSGRPRTLPRGTFLEKIVLN